MRCRVAIGLCPGGTCGIVVLSGWHSAYTAVIVPSRYSGGTVDLIFPMQTFTVGVTYYTWSGTEHFTTGVQVSRCGYHVVLV